MDPHQYIVAPSTVPWKTLALEGGGEAQLQMYLKGIDSGPEAIRAQISEDYTVEPHFHYAAQFQVLLAGSMDFPLVRLDAPAVHYTEHNTPYGPFTVSGGHDMLVLHAKPGGVAVMRDKKRRWQANVRGRELTRCAHEVEWQPHARLSARATQAADPAELRPHGRTGCISGWCRVYAPGSGIWPV